MSARQRQSEVISRAPLRIAAWSGTLSRTDTITGSLICSATGWRMALTGTLDGARTIHLTARFDSPVMADEAAPWTDEFGIIRSFEVDPSTRGAAYDCVWVGTIRKDDAGAWAGEMGDRYGGRLKIEGKSQGNGVMSLRAAVALA